MTDNFLQKLEEKVIVLLSQLEIVRKELNQLKLENANLKTEKLNHSKKLQGLIGLLDSLEPTDNAHSTEHQLSLNNEEEYAGA